MHIPIPIDLLCTGRARPLARAGYPDVPSGILKAPQERTIRLSFHGLEGDEQGDTTYHGGPEKAVHHYAAEHYAMWQARWPDCPVPMQPGAFGENISTSGMTEHTVCIGDIYRAGTALLQVSQGRQPCWKLNRRVGREDAALSMQASGATGWYYRVLREGSLSRHDRFELVERPCPDWPLVRLIAALFPADPAADGWLDEWRHAAGIGPLTVNWKTTFERRVDTGRVEDWARRLHET